MQESSGAEVLTVAAGRARVSVDVRAACPRCFAGRGCGAAMLNGSGRMREIDVAVADGLQLEAGDQVVLAVPSADLLRATLCAYGLPLAGTVSALAVAQTLLGPLADPVAAGAALSGLFSGWLAGRRILRRSPCLGKLTPQIVARRHSPA